MNRRELIDRITSCLVDMVHDPNGQITALCQIAKEAGLNPARIHLAGLPLDLAVYNVVEEATKRGSNSFERLRDELNFFLARPVENPKQTIQGKREARCPPGKTRYRVTLGMDDGNDVALWFVGSDEAREQFDMVGSIDGCNAALLDKVEADDAGTIATRIDFWKMED